jgi:hypothetical protein
MSPKSDDRDLFLLALRVLARFTEGIKPSPEAVRQLAASLPAEQRSLPVDKFVPSGESLPSAA